MAPTLRGRTPRASAWVLRLRPKLIHLLREIENHQDRNQQQGKAWCDIAWLWEELEINRKEA